VYADYIPTAHSHEHGEHRHEHGTSGHNHDHSHDGHHHSHTTGQKLRTNEQGMVTVALPADGIYYLRTIHMVNLPDDPELTHASKWATLTFEVSHAHGADTHTHDHEEEFLPTGVFVLGSVLIIAVLFFVFRNSNEDAA
ncbi:MAG: DUF4198 domain-containing protein, partial [Bacteroidota bacterium]